MFLRYQAHFSHSHRRRGLPGDRFLGAPPVRELGCEAKNFVAAPSSTLRMPARLLPLAKGSCPFEVSILFDVNL